MAVTTVLGPLDVAALGVTDGQIPAIA